MIKDIEDFTEGKMKPVIEISDSKNLHLKLNYLDRKLGKLPLKIDFGNCTDLHIELKELDGVLILYVNKRIPTLPPPCIKYLPKYIPEAKEIDNYCDIKEERA